MCGIFGWVNIANDSRYSRELLKEATDALSHRGPDAEGFWQNEKIAFGHRRLSIIDLKTGQQPMQSARGNCVIFNGEIYNYLELREELRVTGEIFSTNSDTEVLLRAYEVWGISCLEKLVGMFSFVIFDRSKNRLFIARDRLGKKPFFYYSGPSLFAFSSEIKSLLALPKIRDSITIAPQSVSDYLSLGYILTPKTIFKEISKLPAGHYAIFDLSKNALTLHKYWSLESFFSSDKISLPQKELNNLFLEKFNDAVMLRLRSDVGFAGYLSGGIDSSSVILSARRFANKTIDTFTMGFHNKTYDESDYAAVATRYLNVNSRLAFFTPITKTELSKLVWQCDEPFGDNSTVPTYQLNRLTKDFAKVALCGEGADEILAGYPTCAADKFYSLYSRIPYFIQSQLFALARNCLKPSYKKLSWDYILIKFLGSKKLSPMRAHYWWRTIFSEEEKSQILNEEIQKDCIGYDPFNTYAEYFNDVKKAGFLDQTLFVDIKTWLQDDILVKADRMSMANSIEVRSPFLDHRLVEFAARLPQTQKISGFRQKILLRKSMKDLLPRKIITRQKKGFNAPYSKEPISTRESRLLSGRFSLSPEKEDITFKAFNLSVLQAWLDIYESYKKTGNWRALQYDER